MLLDQNPQLEIRANRPKTLVISIAVHVVLVLLIAFNPDWFDSSPRRIIRIAGEDFDLAKFQIQPLYLPPRVSQAAPPPQVVPAPTPQVVQPPQAAPPPPPPPPPPQPQPPERVIRPDDLLVEGARPDGSPRASRGNTPDPARNGGQQAARDAQIREAQEALAAQEAQEARLAQRNRGGTDRVLPNNTNPNALQVPGPSLLASAGKIVDANMARNQTAGRTGIVRSDNNGTFSTDPQILSPNPKGIDFGPYLNQLLTRLRANWYSVMPEMARLGQKGRVDIVFTVTKSGIVKDLQVVFKSDYEPLDRAALSAIHLSNPFQHLPPEYETDLKLRIAFLYNMNP
jgi:TonB family protein